MIKKVLVLYLLIFVVLNQSFGGESVVKTIYKNGLTLIYKETQGQGIVAGSIFIKGGSYEDTKEKAGLTNLALKLSLQGSSKYSQYDISKFFEDSGGYISVSTSEDFSNIDFAVRVEDLPKALDIISDIINNPTFPEDKLQQEKSNIIAQIKARKEEGFAYGFDELRKEIFKGTNYEYSPIGLEESLSKIERKDVLDRWEVLKNSNRMVVSIVGDIPFKEAQKYLKVFERIPKKEKFEFPNVDKKIEDIPCKEIKREGAQSTIMIAYNAPTIKSKDYIPFRVLNGVLGSGFTSRLFQELREKRGLAYAVGSFFPARINIGTVVAYIGTDPKKTEESVKGIRQVVDSLKEGIKEEELNTSKEKIIGSYLMDHQTRAKQAYYLGWFEMLGLGYQMDKVYPNLVKKIKLSDIKPLYEKYLSKESTCIVIKP
jgi:predicted Zn-dependent peptidase